MPFYRTIRPSPFGEYALIWREGEQGTFIYRVFLSRGEDTAPARAAWAFPEAITGFSPFIRELSEKIDVFLTGGEVRFGLDFLVWEQCSGFQQRVLRAEYRIPRGEINTYARIAASLGVPTGARAVGNALANNPFPLIIPCHRAVRSDGSLGGFQGGLPMKRALLENEGISFTRTGKVDLENIFHHSMSEDANQAVM